MKAISIRQPWAWLIVNGYKDIENRTWKTNYRGKLLIHASGKLDFNAQDLKEYRAIMASEAGIDIPEDLPLGGIVGMVDLVDCTMEPDDPEGWHEPGCYGFVLRNPVALPFRPMPGRLNLFEVKEADQ